MNKTTVNNLNINEIIHLTLIRKTMAQIPIGKKRRVARTAGLVQSRSGTVVTTGAC